MKRITKLFGAILTLCLVATAAVACAEPGGNKYGITTPAQTERLTGAATATSAETGGEPGNEDPGSFNLLDGDELVSSCRMTIKATVNNQTRDMDMRLAIISSPVTVYGSVMYIDILDSDGTVLDSTRIAGIGFIALSVNNPSELAVYHLAFRNGRVFAECRLLYVSDTDYTGKALDAPELLTVYRSGKQLSFSVGSDAEVMSYRDDFTDFSQTAANKIANHKGDIVLAYSDGEKAVLNPVATYLDEAAIEKIGSITIYDIAALCKEKNIPTSE